MERKTEVQAVRKYGLAKAAAFSLFSRDLYAEVGGRWKGVGFGYLFLCVALVCLPRAVFVQRMAAKYLPGFADKIPAFRIEKGELTVDVPQPYWVRFGKDAILVDTTGRYTSLAQVPGAKEMDSFILFTKTKSIIHRRRFGRTEDKTHDYSKVHSFSVDREKVKRWTAAVIRWSGTVFYFLVVAVLFIFEAAALVLYALVGVLFAELTRRRLDYDASLRLASVGHTPAFFLSTLLFLTGIHFRGQLPCFIILSTAYLWFAVSAQESALSKSPEDSGKSPS